MKTERPVNLNLFKFHFPVMAIVSILHRVTGLILFIFIPALLYMLHASLLSQDSFSDLQSCLSYPLTKIIFLGVLASAIYHLFAGVRHLVMDFGVGESVTAGRVTAWFMIIATLIVVVLLGVCLW